jgi:methyl-accepting chemotaxis protein
MKVNLPVTDHEVQFEDESLIVSRTDLNGNITFVNRDFIRISGFTEEELIGKPHSLVRHPDMPPLAFEDFWRTLKNGKPWVGMVKNRCKNGDYYWVEANATPIFESGQMVGFLSVRVKPTRQRVERAEAVYRDMREGRAKGITISEGCVVKTGWLSRLNVLRSIHQRARMSTKFGLVGLLLFLPLVISLVLLWSNFNDSIGLNKAELEGVAYHRELRELLPALQNHRGRTGEAKVGNAESARALPSIASTLQTKLRTVDEHTRILKRFSAEQPWMALHRDIDALLAEDARLSVDQSFDRHSELIDRVGSLMDRVADESGMVLDSEAASFHLIFGGLIHAPELANHLAYTRRLGASALLRGSIDQAARLDLYANIAQANQHLEIILAEMASALKAAPDLSPVIDPQTKSMEAVIKGFDALTNEKVILASKLDFNAKEFHKEGSQAVEAAYGLYDKISSQVEDLLRARIDRLNHEASSLLALTLFLFLVGAVIAFWFVRDTCSALQRAVERFREISSGNFKGNVEARTDDEIGDLMRGLKSMQTKLGFDINDSRERAEEALRLKIGLDSTTTNVMIADNDRNIIYMNPSVLNMMREAQGDIRKDLPNFDAERLQGQKIDVFHKNPEHQARLLATFNSTYKATANIGGRTFALTANPVINERGERLGSVVEWIDRTLEVAVEQEVSDIVSAAAAGDFSRRIDEGNKQGFFKVLAEGINKVVATSDAGLKDIARVLGALAKGDLTEKITADYQGTFADLKNYTNETVRSLEQMLRHIREASETIHTAAGEIASGNTDLSSRTEEQAASLEETASSMEEITSTVKQNAQNARQANKLAEGASEVATRGGEVVGHVVTTMGAINESARKIVDIIGVIDGIAFQTNILALNAAVEAARAGEQGRGFAVVAGEVRNLAQRSAAAAKEIKGLIGNSVEKVEDGNRLVETAGKTMEEVVTSIKRVTDIMNEISAASLEQSNGIEQVSTAVTQMDETTQQNAALVEEAAASAEALSGQAATLLEIVRRFRLEDISSEAPVFAAPRASQALPRQARPLPNRPVSKKQVALPAGKPASKDDDDWSEF